MPNEAEYMQMCMSRRLHHVDAREIANREEPGIRLRNVCMRAG